MNSNSIRKKVKNRICNMLPVPLRIQLSIKDKITNIEQKGIEVESQNPKIYIIGESANGNLGDLAINIAHMELLRKVINRNVEIIRLSYAEFWEKYIWLKNNITVDDLITIPGGGNIGDIYLSAGIVQQAVMFSFPQNKIIIFPQTIHFSSEKSILLKNMKYLAKQNEKIIFCAREKISLKKMETYFSHNECILVPDVVLGYKWEPLALKREKILICLRDDKESILSSKEKELIKQLCKQKFLNVECTDTYVPDIHIRDIQKMKQMIEQKFLEFSTAKVVITDRLHGMVFSYLSQTPCVVLKNFDHKVEGIYEWIKEVPYIRLLGTVEEVGDAMDQVIGAKIENSNFPEELYKPLINEIEKWYQIHIWDYMEEK